MPTFSQRCQHVRTFVLLVGLTVALVSNSVMSNTTSAIFEEPTTEITNATLVPPTRFLQSYKGNEFRSLLLAAVNKERAAVGVASLCMSNKLHLSAQDHSNDMAKHNFMSHSGSDGSTMSRRVTAAGFKWTSVAENVAAGQKDVTAVMKSWMSSSGHKKNILSSKYKMFGCGYAYNSKSTYKHYWTQDFGTGSGETCSSSSTPATTPTKIPAVTPATPQVTTKTPAVTTPAATTKVPSTGTMQTQMLAAVNKQRAAAGLSALCMNSKLQSSAQRHSNDMASNDFMSHTGSDGSSMAQRITAAGYSWQSLAENVAAGQTTVDSVMTAWMNSSGHKANILSSKATMFGCAYAYNADSTYKHYWTQDFGAGSTESCS